MTRLLGCTRYRKHYSAFRDGTLAPQGAAEAQGHLDLCEKCRRRHHALEFGVRLLRALDRQSAHQPLLQDEILR